MHNLPGDDTMLAPCGRSIRLRIIFRSWKLRPRSSPHRQGVPWYSERLPGNSGAPVPEAAEEVCGVPGRH